MTTIKKILVVSVFVVGSILGPTKEAHATLQLKRVSLSSAGVGYFEFHGLVQPNAVIKLPVRYDQVDDVLKSLIIQDSSGQGANFSIASKPSEELVLKDLAISPSHLVRLSTLLEEFQGQPIRLRLSGRPALRGRLMFIEKAVSSNSTDRSQNSPEIDHLVLSTSQGIARIALNETTQIEFDDPELQRRLNQALEAIANASPRGKKDLLIRTHGNTQRMVRVGYVVQVPIWKTSYRLFVPESSAAQGQARLQGWAILENASGVDWSGVELTLTSGKPVTFTQRLYESYLAPRVEIPVDLPNRVVPAVDQGGFESRPQARSDQRPAAAPAPAPLAAPAAAPMAAPSAMRSPSSDFMTGQSEPRSPQFAQIEQDTQTELRLENKVHVAHGQTLVAPFVDVLLPLKRRSLLSSLQETQPWASANINNPTKASWPAGAVSVYGVGNDSTQYQGDAQMPIILSGQSRMLAFARDQKLQATNQRSSETAMSKVSLKGRVLEIDQISAEKNQVTVRNFDSAVRELMVQVFQNPANDWDSRGLTPTETTFVNGRAVGRFLILATPGQTSHLIAQSITRTSRIDLTNADDAALRGYLRVSGDPKTSQILSQWLGFIGQENALRSQESGINRRVTESAGNQIRLRENLKAVDRSSALHASYMEQLQKAESDMVRFMQQKEAIRTELDELEQKKKAILESLEKG